jgi:hypothetical protein
LGHARSSIGSRIAGDCDDPTVMKFVTRHLAGPVAPKGTGNASMWSVCRLGLY